MDHLAERIPGYLDTTPLYASARTTVCRAVRAADQRRVVLKLRRRAAVSAIELDRTHHEFDILRRLRAPGVVAAYGLEATGSSIALVLEDVEGISLARHLDAAPDPAGHALPLPAFFPIATAIVDALGDVHAAGVIHKDINPSNIMLSPASGAVRLIDFDLATTLSRETPLVRHPRALEGTLAYLSPELSGRTSRGVDYRTDFYALGVTFYELLTGRLPFLAADALELVHCHLARAPEDPARLNPAIPPALARLVLKLMAKAPEDRYQSADGLRRDLLLCQRHLAARGAIPDFALGAEDRAHHFLVPERLYGRDEPVGALLEAFERAAQGPAELVLVTGFAGVGKSAVIREVHRPILARRGLFARGKFEQFGRAVPFGGFVQALRDVVGQVLSAPEAERRAWRAQLLEALGESAQVIVDVLPELEQLIGPQPAVPNLAGAAALNRFNLLFQKFVAALAAAEHPLVLFLDDLQWADLASLKLLQLLLAEGSASHLLLLGAYRDNEVSPTHALAQLVDELRRGGARVSAITLAPLGEADIGRLVADALGGPRDGAEALARLVYRRARGNPFFTTQLLKALYEDGVISYQREGRYWQCDVERASAVAPTDDVVEFMARQIERLPPETLELVTLAACVGSQFDLATLARVSRHTLAEAAARLWPAVQDGLVVPLGEIYAFAAGEDSSAGEPPPASAPSYRFFHDRVRQAAYARIPEDRRPAIHLDIGRLLVGRSPAHELDEELFAAVNHLNTGAELIEDPRERLALARLNQQAGRRAKLATASAAALGSFQMALRLLPDDCWQRHYALTLALHEDLAEAAYLSGDFGEMDRRGDEVLWQALDLLDTVKVYETKIHAHISRNDPRQALQLGLRVLRELGAAFPERPGEADITAAFEEVGRALGGKAVAELRRAPLMTDPVGLATMRLLLSIGAPCFLVAPALYPLLIARQLTLSIALGNTPISAYAYVSYGTLLGGIVGDMEGGRAFGQLGLGLLHDLRARELLAKTYFMYYVFIHHWSSPIAETLAPLLEAYQTGFETGDLEFGAYSLAHRMTCWYFSGADLRAIAAAFASSSPAIHGPHLGISSNYFDVCHQAVLNLLGRSADPCVLSGAACDEERVRRFYEQTGELSGLHNLTIHTLVLQYLFGRYEQALAAAERSERLLPAVPGIIAVVVHTFYDSLTRLALWDSCGGEREPALRKVERNQELLARWAAGAPTNYRHKYDLVEAERCRVTGDQLAAMDAYDRAIAGARAGGFQQEEALANELAARFYLGAGRERVAQAYLQEALRVYGRWGAAAKARQLAQSFAGLLPDALEAHALPPDLAGRRHTLGVSTDGAALDLATVMKAMQAIAGEIDLGRLLTQVLRIAIENAGAQRGALLLERGDAWAVEAHGDVDRQGVDVLQALDLGASGLASPEIVAQVAGARAALVLDDAARSGAFAGSAYVRAHGVRSVICAPLINQGRLSAIVYLENNRIANAFTPERLELLNLLSAQMALALDNARLYQDLEAKIAERTRSLAEARDAAEAASQAKSAFLSSMSHELRTPLNGILGYAAILRRTARDQHTLEGLDVIAQSGEHLLNLINDVLDLAKIEAGKLELNLADVHLASFLLSLVGIVRVRAEAKDLRLGYSAPDTLPMIVRADERRLRQVLLNLLSNAVKFTERGGVDLIVTARDGGAAAGGRLALLRFEVRDTGIGIDAEHLGRLFLPFEQVSDAGRQAEGTGLGLAISRQIVELMGGTLLVESVPRQGSTFWFEIAAPVVAEVDAAETPARQITGYTGPRRLVLVVDDVAVNRAVVRELLTPLGFVVQEAVSAEDAVAAALAGRPDVVLMDIVMAGRTGLEATRELRAAGATMPVIAASASALPNEVERALAAGCDQFLPKPLRREALLAALGKRLGLEWVYGEEPQPEPQREPPGAWPPPPAAVLERMLELAERGSLQALDAQVTRLAEEMPRYAALAEHVHALVRVYDEERLGELLTELRERLL